MPDIPEITVKYVRCHELLQLECVALKKMLACD